MTAIDQPKKRWPRDQAIAVARELCQHLTPVCERIIVAGSLRRGKSTVGDVEILFIPRTAIRTIDLFSSGPVSMADEEIQRMLDAGILTKRIGSNGHTAWGDKNKLAVHRSGIPVDLFASTWENWWNYLVCRTGPAESNIRIANAALALGYRWNPYGPGYTRLADGEVILMDSEEAVFRFVGLPFNEPTDRQ